MQITVIADEMLDHVVIPALSTVPPRAIARPGPAHQNRQLNTNAGPPSHWL